MRNMSDTKVVKCRLFESVSQSVSACWLATDFHHPLPGQLENHLLLTEALCCGRLLLLKRIDNPRLLVFLCAEIHLVC